MKKFFMLLAVAGFFSMTTISCGGEAAKEGDKTEEGAADTGAEGEGGDHAGHGH